MIETKIINDETSIYIECPHCGSGEEIDEDHPRHKLGSFNLISWEPDQENKNEVSLMACLDSECKKEFLLEWDYHNYEQDEGL